MFQGAGPRLPVNLPVAAGSPPVAVYGIPGGESD